MKTCCSSSSPQFLAPNLEAFVMSRFQAATASGRSDCPRQSAIWSSVRLLAQNSRKCKNWMRSLNWFVFLNAREVLQKKEKGCIECRDTGAKTKNIAIRNFLFVPRPTIKNRTRTKRYKIHAEPVRFLRPQAEAPEGNIANEARNVVDSPVY